jgi:DNA-binding response OmpR family regulator
MKMLIIEDDLNIAKSLKRELSKNYAIDLAFNGKKGIYKALTNEYDLIILDLTLPDLTGLDVCSELRREGIIVPIMILTGKNTLESKILLLNAGADDYVVKPFYLAELKARIRALFRRKPNFQNNLLTAGELSINLNTKNVFFRKKLLKLARKEFLILSYLMRNKNIPISRMKLVEHIWEGDSYFESNVIDVYICNIRQKIGKFYGSKILKTSHGIGYKLCDAKSYK